MPRFRLRFFFKTLKLCFASCDPFSFKKGSKAEKAALSLLLAGGLGNLTDRVCQGHVDDYIRIPCRQEKLSRIVFNLADVFIAVGTGLTVISALKNTTDCK